jgi:hypothetical protein
LCPKILSNIGQSIPPPNNPATFPTASTVRLPSPPPIVRHLAKVPKSTFAAYPGCIVIAAGGLKPVDVDASLVSFDDVFRYGANGLVLDLDAVSLRFEERTASNKSPREPNKAMLEKM